MVSDAFPRLFYTGDLRPVLEEYVSGIGGQGKNIF
jgi:hypothetical protein